MTQKTPVVILNMHYTGIGIARSLYDLDVPIIGLGKDRKCFGAHSKFCEFKIAPDSNQNPDLLLHYLIDLSNSLQLKPILLPTRDYDIQFISNNYETLKEHYVVPQDRPEVIAKIADKNKLLNTARELGMSCPDEIKISDSKDFSKHRNQISFPCVAKPIHSQDWRGPELKHIVGNRKAIQFDNLQNLEEFYTQLKTIHPQIIIQQEIVGPDSNIHVFSAYINKNKSTTYYYTARKLLQYPMHYGTGIVLESYNSPEIIEPSLKLINTLDYSGMCEFEYKRDQRNNKFYLIEINTRHWDQHLLGTAFGVNLTQEQYLDWTNSDTSSWSYSADNEIKTKWIADQELPFAAISLLLSKQIGIKTLACLVNGKKLYGSIDFRDVKLCFFSLKTSIVTLLTLSFYRLFKPNSRRNNSSPT